jgi:hypothetical protein
MIALIKRSRQTRFSFGSAHRYSSVRRTAASPPFDERQQLSFFYRLFSCRHQSVKSPFQIRLEPAGVQPSTTRQRDVQEWRCPGPFLGRSITLNSCPFTTLQKGSCRVAVGKWVPAKNYSKEGYPVSLPEHGNLASSKSILDMRDTITPAMHLPKTLVTFLIVFGVGLSVLIFAQFSSASEPVVLDLHSILGTLQSMLYARSGPIPI